MDAARVCEELQERGLAVHLCIPREHLVHATAQRLQLVGLGCGVEADLAEVRLQEVREPTTEAVEIAGKIGMFCPVDRCAGW